MAACEGAQLTLGFACVHLLVSETDLNIDLQVSNDVGHMVSQVPKGQSSCMQGQVSGAPCLSPHDSPTALKISLNALQPQQVLEDNIVLGHHLQNEAMRLLHGIALPVIPS